jgi:phage/plasmid primase-like uncharacterized protein
MIDLRTIAAKYGGKLSGKECLIPTPGHSRDDRGTAIRLAPGAPDGLLVTCYNGGQPEALAVKDMLRADGFLAPFDGKRRELTKVERDAIRRAELEREQERQQAQAKAAQIARQRLAGAHPADRGHPYLVRKRIAPERLYQAGGALLVPMGDTEGNLWNVQRIDGDGSKRFLTGGRIKGTFWHCGKTADRLIIGEGMATCAAVRRATGLPVVAAMTASNLPDIAAAIRVRRPDLTLIIAADDDPAGLKAARTASHRTGALIALPGDIAHD